MAVRCHTSLQDKRPSCAVFTQKHWNLFSHCTHLDGTDHTLAAVGLSSLLAILSWSGFSGKCPSYLSVRGGHNVNDKLMWLGRRAGLHGPCWSRFGPAPVMVRKRQWSLHALGWPASPAETRVVLVYRLFSAVPTSAMPAQHWSNYWTLFPSKHWPNVFLMLARRLWRRPNIKTTLGQCLVFAEFVAPPPPPRRHKPSGFM